MDTETLLQKLKSQLKLKSSKTGGVFGLIKRVPFHLYQPKNAPDADSHQLVLIMSTASAQASSRAVSKLKVEGPLKSANVTGPDHLSSKGATIQLRLDAAQLASLNADSFAKLISETAQLISKIPHAIPWPAPGAKLVLLDGVVPTHLVIDESGNIQSNQTGMFPLGKARANIALAGAFGLGAMLLGHLAWAYIYAFVNTSSLFQDNVAFILYVLAAVWFGALIGWLAIKGAGTMSSVVGILIAMFSGLGIFCGQILGNALILQNQSGQFDFKLSTDNYVENLLMFDAGSLIRLIFPVAGALFGAFLAAGLAGNSKAKSKIEHAESGVHRQSLPAESTTASV